MGLIALAVSILTPFASANVLDRTDYERVSSLVGNALQLERDIFNVAHGIGNGEARDCVLELQVSIDAVRADLTMLLTLVNLSILMADRSDEQTVLEEFRREGEYFAKTIDFERKRINTLAGGCSWTNVVPMKAQEILAFYGQALTQVSAVLSQTHN